MIDPTQKQELTGWWGLMLKFTLVLFPLFVGSTLTWGAWVTREILHTSYFRDYGPRFTVADGRELESRLERHLLRIDERIDALPKPSFRERVATLEKDSKEQLKQSAQILAELKHLRAAASGD